MSNQDETRSPFTRPGFLVAAVLVGAIVVVGVVLGILNATRAGDDPPDASPTPAEPGPSATSPDPSAQPTDDESVCGLKDGDSEGTLSTAPETEWQFQGTTAYPTSSTYGPGATDENGVRYCFQRSPQGALFMAANAIPQGSDPSVSSAWVDYALAEGPYREQLLGEMGGSPVTEGMRLSTVGFRLLHYDGETARVDLAVRGSAAGQAATLSGVYELVWQHGDWRISADISQPLDMATIPDAAGYISWGE
ncbi:hypothetical protein V2J52_16700 [Georgenia sp. MJ173]|uniref:hypothetical protein n=1 Tax=Georgenia sunbinii TaxID=3117728 RepID=UPI002F2602F1